MGFASLVTGAFVVLTLCTAMFNFWLYRLRPGVPAHFWLGVSSLGVCWIGTGALLIYRAPDLAAGQAAHITSLTGAPLLVIGFLRFTSLYLDIRMPRFEWGCGVYAVLGTAAVNLAPGFFFTGEAIEVVDPRFGGRHVEAVFAPTVALVLVGFLVMFGVLTWLFTRYRLRLESPRLMIGSIGVWAMAAGNDASIALGLHHGPYLSALGFAAFDMAFTAMLVGRFVTSARQLEASTEVLQETVEEKTRELREKDLQLAHGARLSTVGALSLGLAQAIDEPTELLAGELEEVAGSWKDPAERGRLDARLASSRESVERIRAIVSDLLRIARRDPEDEGHVELPGLIEWVVAVAQHDARGRARIVAELEPVPAVRGSETLLAQVVLNLLLNGLHAIPEDAPGSNTVTVRTFTREGAACLSVEDTGQPIAPERVPMLFDPFQPEATGEAGLSLPVTHQLVERHRGAIRVETLPTGNRFVVTLPAEADDEEAA